MWGGMVKGIPQGLPESGDRGLDHTHTWGRTYWGGALFCLIADVEIRKATKTRKGLQDALRGIVDAGGNITVHWPIEKAFETGDRATGTHVLTNLYEQMKAAAVRTDLPALWKELGVRVNGDTVSFDDHAPLAQVRAAINVGPGMHERIGLSKQ
jgi:predicted metalloprotease with PDZ domain